MEVIANNLTEVLAFLGLAILAIEVVILGFSTFVLFFVGLACLLISAMMFIGVLPETLVSAFLGVAVLTAALAYLLWKPLKKMQNKVDYTRAESDLVGLSFILEGSVSSEQSSTHKYSGIEWKVLSTETLAAGTEVEVVKIEVGAFTVAAKAA